MAALGQKPEVGESRPESCCGVLASVMGWRREPAPPASMIPFIEKFFDVGPAEMVKQFLVRAGGAGVTASVAGVTAARE